MHQQNAPDVEIEGWLKTLGVEALCQWHVLDFLYRHQTSLVGADYLARLLGYAAEPVVAALDVLESLELVERSRISQGARLYQFTEPSEPLRGKAFERLRALAGHRAGRLLLSKQLRRALRKGLKPPGASSKKPSRSSGRRGGPNKPGRHGSDLMPLTLHAQTK